MFYVGYDDAEDLYTDGRLKESFPGPADSLRDYRYGYGHGFSPYNEIIRTLDLHRTDSISFCSEMADKEAMIILSRVAQDYDQNEETSFTQYSALYNSTEKTLTVCVMQDYANEYVFSFEK